MKEELFTVFNENDEHDFDIIKRISSKKTTYILKRSINKQWAESARGEEVITIVDDGNGIKLSNVILSKDELSYCQFLEIYILIRFIFQSDKHAGYGKIYKTELITKF